MPTTFLTKTALTIAGSDSSGGTGIQADLKTFAVLGVYGMTAITAVAAQNTLGIKEVLAVSAELVARQIDQVASDIDVDVCKSGMLGSAEVVEAVEAAIQRNKLAPYVCDPVLFSRDNERLLAEDAVDLVRRKLFPLASIVTPNLRETATYSKIEPERGAPWTILLAKEAARKFIDLGARSVVIKRIEHDDQMVDLFFDGREFLEFAARSQPREKSHGSGSAFSAAIAAGLANRLGLVDAIDQAKQLVTAAIQYSDGQGRGTAPINILGFVPKKK